MPDSSESPKVTEDLSAAVQTLRSEGLTAQEIAKLLEVDELRVSAILKDLIDAWEAELSEPPGSSIEDL